MKLAKLRLAVAVGLFCVWLGWLAYLACTKVQAQPVVLSRPQFLVSSLDVIAEVDAIDGKESKVRILDVHWPRDQSAQELKDHEITVVNLTECRSDWPGPGRYILPLVQVGPDAYQVAPTPRSPGFARAGQPRIYPDNPQTEEQLKTIPKPELPLPPP
jgi:hypothetical protein